MIGGLISHPYSIINDASTKLVGIWSTIINHQNQSWHTSKMIITEDLIVNSKIPAFCYSTKATPPKIRPFYTVPKVVVIPEFHCMSLNLMVFEI